jgi:hypothetical protein|tara:strand:+ start:452 stop:1531 length:1080 start_codon:yes stop_codon:yes gene_type:complete
MKIINFLKSKLPHKIYDKSHYGKFLGSFDYIRIISWNFFHPYRIINRLRWNTLFSNSKLKIKKFKNYIINSKLENDKLSDKLDALINNGGLLIEKYFDEKKIDNFLVEYKHLIDTEKEALDSEINHNMINKNNFYSYRIINLHLSNALIDVWLDDRIINFLEHYLGQKVYAREYPRLVYTKYFFEKDLNSKDKHEGKYKNSDAKVPYFWHVDHSAGLVSLHILLEDISLNSTHMQYLPESNKYLNSRDLYSDETVEKFKNKPVDCIGKKGSIYFHTGNTLHRVVGKKNSSRLGLIFSFSPGTSMEIDCKRISKAFSTNFDIDALQKKKREILKGIYPLNGNYDLINSNFLKPKFDEKLN